VALPALTSIAARLTERFAGDPVDVHAEILSGFLTGLAEVDLARPRVMLRLRWVAYRAGYTALREALAAPVPTASRFRSVQPLFPWGHPDLVLADAVREGVITRAEAQVIGATRLDETTVAEVAAEHAMTEWAVYKMRRRAEHRLVAHLLDRNDDAAAPARRSRVVSKNGDSGGVQRCRQLLPDRTAPEDPRCA
jgi:hypothetical protein